MTKQLLILALLVSKFVFALDPDLTSWATEQRDLAFKKMMRNVSPPGAVKGVVIASPSQKEPDYYYHWVRDAAITMEIVYKRYAATNDAAEKQDLEDHLFDFAKFSLKNQKTPNLSGGLGEPKFYVDGEPYLGPWGRPQDDGPALRALVLTHFAKSLLDEGKEETVRERLYSGKGDSVIKADLEYVARSWGQTSFDLWEEVRGRHFFTAMVQRRSLLEGAWLARRLGDASAGDWYETQARALENLIQRFWDPKQGVLVGTIDQDAGVAYKSGLDTSVVIGLLLGNKGDGFFPLDDERVLRTVGVLEKAFYDLYPVNKTGARGFTLGRYPEDRYDGYSTNGQGNPWVLITAYFAKYYYQLANRLEKRSTTHEAAIAQELGFSRALENLIFRLRSKGDDFLFRVKYHAQSGGLFSEQINRHSGYMQGAQDLTWSYGSLLDALESKKAF